MYLEEIELKDWGPHVHIHEHLSDPVVGLLGDNGSGKTNVLEAIQFAFTGLLAKKNETYVREFGEEGGANNASVRVVFSMAGVKGEIFRQIGKTPKRTITWDGREETSDKGCNKLMAEIFEADREAVANAVFITQGTLDKMLFGKPAERYELFVKLLLLGYLEKRSKLVESKYMALSNGLQDFTTLLDDLTRQEGEIANTLASIEGEISQTHNWAAEIAQWDEFKACEEDLIETSGQISQLRTDIKSAEESLRNTEGESFTLEVLEKKLQDAQEQRETKSQELLDTRELLSTVRNYNASVEEKEAHEKEFDEKSIQLERTQTSLKETAGLEDSLSAAKSHRDIQAELEAQSTESDRLKESIETKEAEKPPMTEQELASTKEELETENTKMVELRIRSELLLEASSKTDSSDNCCPVCQSTVSEDLLSEENIKAANDAYEAKREVVLELQSKVTRCETFIQEKDKSLKDLNAEMLKATRATLDAIKASRELPAKPAESVEELETQLEARRLLERQEITLKSETANADRNLRVAKTKVDSVDKSVLEKAKGISPGYEEKLAAEVETLRQAVDTYKAHFERVQPVVDLIKNKKGALEHNEKRVATLKPLLAKAVDGLSPRVVKIAEEKEKKIRVDIEAETMIGSSKDEVKAVTEELDERQGVWNSLQGRLTQAKQSKKQVEARRTEVDASVAKDKVKRELIEELKQVKDMLGKSGIVTEIINDRYARLVEITQEHLANLDSNFMVEQDPDNPVSVRFWRVDKNSEYRMSQDKLSGGQKVRYTVAFLLAVQQLIIPEVGFLVLDEPSVHVDKTGVESLKELLINLGSQLSSAESQVIVCDHNEALEPAFGEVIRLK